MTLIPTRAPSLVGWVLGFLPWWAWAALVALALATSAGLGHRAGAAGVQQRWDAEKAAAARQALEASQEARRIEQARAAKVQESQDHARQIASAARQDAAGARTELDRLRSILAERDRVTAVAAGAQCRVDAGATERKLFQSCAEALAGMGEQADADRTRLIELQGWVKAILGGQSAHADR
jgi:hypothetical protein